MTFVQGQGWQLPPEPVTSADEGVALLMNGQQTPIYTNPVFEGPWPESPFGKRSRGGGGSVNGRVALEGQGWRVLRENPLLELWRYGSYVWSSLLLLFCTFVLFVILVRGWTTSILPQGANIFEVLVLLFWIALLEGVFTSIVGLKQEDPEWYSETHPRAYRIMVLIKKGNNRERFIVGRQLLLTSFVFFLTQACGWKPPYKDANRTVPDTFHTLGWSWSESLDATLLQQHLLYIFFVTIVGNLVTQSVAADKMLGFLNLPLGHYYFCVLPSLAVEWTGIAHVTYPIRALLVRWFKMPKDPEDAVPATAAPSLLTTIFYWLRCIMSFLILMLSGTMVMLSLIAVDPESFDWPSLGLGAAIAILIALLMVLSVFAGMQVSIVELYRTPVVKIIDEYPWAYKTFVLLHKNKNLQNVLIGRQVFVSAVVVLLSRAGVVSSSTTDFFGLPQWFVTVFMRTGILGTLFCVVVGQLTTRSLATSYPKAYLNSRFMHTMVWLTLTVSGLGFFNAAWPLGFLFMKIAKPDRKEHDVAGAGGAGHGMDSDVDGDDSAEARGSRVKTPSVEAKGRPAVLNW